MAEDSNGWIESTDPTTGRTFYANRYTRTTQWDPPPGWNTNNSIATSDVHSTTQNNIGGHNNRDTSNVLSDISRTQRHQNTQIAADDNMLPDGWEEMTDQTTGRKFYIDHATKTTTWERPTTHSTSNSIGGERRGHTASEQENYGLPIMKLNQNGNHKNWDDNIHSGSRSSSHYNNNGYKHQDDSYGLSLSSSTSEKGKPPPLDFTVISVLDSSRLSCPGCNTPFTYYIRRHHCRLCGDVFCSNCSNNKTILPLDGEEFNTPVRVCNWCFVDVKNGNYFSMRRYLTPLQLYNPNETGNSGGKRLGSLVKENEGGSSGETCTEITINTVAASLSSLSSDIDSLLVDPMNCQDKITIPSNVLICAVGKHLKERMTAEYAIRVLASLLMLGNVVGDDSFALAVYEVGDDAEMKKSESTNTLESNDDSEEKRELPVCEIVNDVLSILEWNGCDSRSLSALEQATKVIYYISEPNFIESAISKRESNSYEENRDEDNGDEGPIDVDEVGMSMHDFIQIDIHRAFRSMLDHATSSTSPSLQRWATATLRHLITEDRRRACVYSSGANKYQSFMNQLVNTGGIMILCSLLSSDDSETRTHATSTLESIVISTREISLALHTSPGQGGFSRVGRGTKDDAAIVDAIVSNGGCGPALAHLLISAEESVAYSGCSFASALISPLLTDPRGSGQSLQQLTSSGGVSFDEAKDDGLSSYRHAALSLVVGDSSTGSQTEASCLPSLIQILRSGSESTWDGKPSRSIKLQVVAGECLASISLAIGHILSGVSTDKSGYDSLYSKAQQALEIMEREQIYDVTYKIVTSDSSRSLDPSRNTPQARLREAAGLTLLALSSCSSISSSYLISNKAVSGLISIAGECLDAPSALRGEWASRGLCYLECASQLILQSFQTNDASCLNLLLGSLDAGAVGIASKYLKEKVHLRNHDKAYRQMRIKMAICYMLAAMFGIATKSGVDNAVGASRLYSAVDADCAAAFAYGNNESDERSDLVASTVFLLSATLPYAQKYLMEDKDEPLPMMDLSQACLLAVGSMCGARSEEDTDAAAGEVQQDKYSHLRQDASSIACKAILASSQNGGCLLPSVLIGALGGCLVSPALRLTLAIAQNAPMLRGELASCGMIVPLVDILQQSLSSGDRSIFSTSIAIVRYCGPCASVERSNSGSVSSLANSIRTLSVVLTMPDTGDYTMDLNRRNTPMKLKLESLLALEALSVNESLHSTLISDAFPALIQFLLENVLDRMENQASLDESMTEIQDMSDTMVCSALKTIQSIISLPSSISPVAIKGLITSLVKIMNQSNGRDVDDSKQTVALELLHSIASNKKDIAGNGCFLSSGVLESVASLLDDSSSSKVTCLGLGIIEFIISDVDATYSPHIDVSLRNGMLQQFTTAMRSQEPFLRALISTMVTTKDCTVSISPLYGSSLCLPEGTASQPTKNKAIKILFGISSILCNETTGKDDFLNALMLKNARDSAESVALACSQFLHILMDEVNGVCVPNNPTDKGLFLTVKLPVVRSQLLEALSSSLDECMNMTSDTSRKQAERMICDFKIPQLCLSYCQSQAVSQAAFDLYENVVLPLPNEVLGELLLSDKSSLVTLFSLVTGQNNCIPDVEHSKQTFASTLGNLATAGLLGSAVERFGVRNHAIAALCSVIEGSQDGTIDESEDSLPRICVESLAVILFSDKQQDTSGITVLEAKIMATSIGKVLSATLLNRFFTQASLETTLDYTIDHSSDRSAISQSSEARLLCSLASFPESLDLLRKVGGLEAIGLIAHEGSLPAIQAVQKACELSPKSVVEVDAHLSIMDALIQVEDKLLKEMTDTSKLREVVVNCLQITTSLSQNTETKSAIQTAEQSLGCITVAIGIISSSSKSLCGTLKRSGIVKEKNSITSKEKEDTSVVNKPNTQTISKANDDFQLGDKVLVESTSRTSPTKSGQADAELEGIIAHLGPVKFAPGDDWIGIRLTGSSVGLGRNNGTVKGEYYFDCDDKNGFFAKQKNVKKRPCEVEDDEVACDEEKKDELDELPKDEVQPPVVIEQESTWKLLLLKDDLTLEKAALSLLLALSSSKTHQDLMMQSEVLLNSMTDVIQVQSSALIGYQCASLELLLKLTQHLHKAGLTHLFLLIIESRTRVVQVSRDRREQAGSKKLLALAISGLQNIFSSFMNSEEQSRSLKLSSDLFVFLVDSLYKGPRSRRTAASVEDGQLFYNLSSFFLLAIGSRNLMETLFSTRFISSLMRYIEMAAGVTTLDCHVPFKLESEGGEYWEAALSYCLHCLSGMIGEMSHKEGISFDSLVAEVESSPHAFQQCLKHIADTKLGVSSISAKQIIKLM